MSFWPEDEENGGSELTMSSQLRKTRSMDSSCLELRLGPPPQSQSTSAGLGHGGHGQGHTGGHMSAALSRARSEANLHASTLSLGPGKKARPLTFRELYGLFIMNERERRKLVVYLAEQVFFWVYIFVGKFAGEKVRRAIFRRRGELGSFSKLIGSSQE